MGVTLNENVELITHLSNFGLYLMVSYLKIQSVCTIYSENYLFRVLDLFYTKISLRFQSSQRLNQLTVCLGWTAVSPNGFSLS